MPQQRLMQNPAFSCNHAFALHETPCIAFAMFLVKESPTNGWNQVTAPPRPPSMRPKNESNHRF